MKSEIRILLVDGASNKAKGNCFESLVRNILNLHLYEIRGNINYAGMEIDLVAEHKHNKETLYVECKAKEKVSSDELSKFAFNVDHKEIDKGYFFRTQELEFQAGALLSEIRAKPKNKNLTFFEPADIIEILCDGKMLFEPLSELKQHTISKKILAVTYIGDFFIYLIHEYNAIPTKCFVVNAQENHKDVQDEEIELLKSRIDEIANLNFIKKIDGYTSVKNTKTEETLIESVSEVQESENWYDYLPASSDKKHFVGRDDIRTQILQYFKDISNAKTGKRIFYLNGKSGWGKSSLVLEIKGRSTNKHYKNKFYALAIDTRSANSDNFVALSFKKLIQKSYSEGFIKQDMFSKEISFTSNVDLISSDSINTLLDKLKIENKFLILIFDQFEDVFRKKDYFKTFYKFLSDVTDKKPNLIIGFSWKSDFFIQSDDPSYHIWQQAREQAREFTVNEFGEKEIDGIIKQLEESIGLLDKSIKDRIKESSQGLPWLTKKLCIHIYDQIQSGLYKENLLESNLNILDLFKKDEEGLDGEELKAIKLIAKRAYDSSYFDETEVGDVIDGQTIAALLHKRLIIRSGANYNIYWDIYRDYLVTGKIPIIGESYLLRQGVNLCLEVFLLFETRKKETLESLLIKHPKGISQETLNNILIELKNIGLINKIGETVFIPENNEISKDGFINFITSKFQNYTPYQELKKLQQTKISKIDIINTLKSIFKQEFQDNTWDAYAKNLISWFILSNLDIKSKLAVSTRGRASSTLSFNINNKEIFCPRSSIREIVEIIPLFNIDKYSIKSRYNKDLFYLGLIDNEKELTKFGKILLSSDEVTKIKLLKVKAQEFPKLKILESLTRDNKLKSKEIIHELPNDFFEGIMESSKIIYATKALSWLK